MADVLIIAGEPSGEEHAMSFLPELMSERADLKFWGVGGEKLESLGVELKYHLKDFSSMGFSEVVAKIPFYKRALKSLVDEAIKRNVKDAVLIDFQDFNLRLAQHLAKQGIRVWYYVAPQAWAWRPWRAKTLDKCTHKLFTILPFETSWFRSRGVTNIVPIPHPLISNWSISLAKLHERPWRDSLLVSPRLILLPGSRRSEVGVLLPIFVEVVKALKKEFPEIKVTLAKVTHLDQSLYDCARSVVDHWIDSDHLAEELLHTDTALAASGTVTLGTGLLGVPTIVTYHSSLLNEFVVRKIIKYHQAVSLTNLILKEMIFPEFLQQQAQAPLITNAIRSLWSNPSKWNDVTTKLSQLPKLMSDGEKNVGIMMAKEMKR
jgi:lipid-A-disaccharide synthase